MKLFKVVTLRISLLAIIILTFWSIFFYHTIINEVNDEVDDALEDYAETIVRRTVSNIPLPSSSIGSNNQFFIKEVSEEYAHSKEHIKYEDREVYIDEKNEFEPARVLTYIFNNDEGNYFELEVSTPHIDKTDLKEAIFFWIVFLFIVLFISILLMNLWTIHRSTKPLKKLLEWLNNYRVGENTPPLNNNTKIYEFQTLNNVVQESLNRTEEAYKQQKLFIGNASHEMQTPLTVCNSRLEILLNDPNLTESQLEQIIKTRQTIERLSKMNRSLLLLTKLDNKQFTDSSKISLNKVIERILPDYQMVYSSKEISVTTSYKGSFIVDMNPSLSENLISNMLKNAYVHNINGGEINIISDNDFITFENTGDAKPLDKELIFKYFYHDNTSNQSIGLGLPVVKSICKNYNLDISYKYHNGKHSFTIKNSKS